MKAVRVAANAKGKSISGSALRGSLADTPRATRRAVSTRAWKPEPQHMMSPGIETLHLRRPPPLNTHTQPKAQGGCRPSH